ncbi:Rap1a/Tai family immunity protein [Pseudaestuariivita rosea]|uniref:Rap1a/Tai family immunity protein n=1 Tax=Pseudaestuariivita rosea TaxID=2763263 RepID=UPI001ABBACB6|nr:Rap1a/Tai family immunity protein [Pseudaestuariivita rosea]
MLATLMMLGPSSASPQSLDGNTILDFCSSSNLGDNGFCFGYVFGVNDGGMYTALNVVQQADGGQEPLQNTVQDLTTVLGYCTPNTVAAQQMVDVFVSYLEDNPQVRHRPAQILFTQAMTEAFPCR